MPLYIGEADGARVLAFGMGTADATSASTTDVLMDLTTHPLFPAGPSGDVMFRAIQVTIRHDAGAHLGVTPYVDDTALAEQTFSVAPPASGEKIDTVQAFVASRGAGIHARVRQTDATGMVEIVDIASEHAVLRVVP